MPESLFTLLLVLGLLVHLAATPAFKGRLEGVRVSRIGLKLFDPEFVIFIGGAEFKTPMPVNVPNRGLRPWIRNHTATLPDPAVVHQACARLDPMHRSTDRQAAARDRLKGLNPRRA